MRSSGGPALFEVCQEQVVSFSETMCSLESSSVCYPPQVNKANDSIAVARKRFSGQNSRNETDSPSSSQGQEAVGSPSSSLNRKGSPSLSTGDAASLY